MCDWRNWRIPAAAVALLFGSSFVVAVLFPALFNRFYVKPSELQLETPYIERNIALTRQAYNLQQIAVKPFPAEEGLSFASLEANRATVDNIRLWDWQPLMDTYAQLQEIRTYYKFLDMDIDRYRLGGTYQQVMLSARELEPSLLPSNAQTWVNLHLLFTHGNGVVMSPVTQKTSRRPADLLPAGHPAGRQRRSRHPRAAPLFRPGRASAMRSSRAARPSSTIPRARTTSMPPTTAPTASPSATRRGAPCSPGITAIPTSCSPSTSPARAASCFIATSRTACARSPRSCASTTIPISW